MTTRREFGQLEKMLTAMLAAPDAVAALSALLRYLLATHPRVGARKIVDLVEATARTRPAARKRTRAA